MQKKKKKKNGKEQSHTLTHTKYMEKETKTKVVCFNDPYVMMVTFLRFLFEDASISIHLSMCIRISLLLLLRFVM